MKKRALVSVSDKTGIVELGDKDHWVELLLVLYIQPFVFPDEPSQSYPSV